MAWADFTSIPLTRSTLGNSNSNTTAPPSFDRRADQRGATSYTTELGTGLTSWWHSELELGFDRAPGDNQPTLLTQAVWENMIQLTEPGEQFADVGFYFEYGQSTTRGPAAAANEVTFGPVIAKDWGRTVHTLNLFLTRQLGPDQTTQGLDFSYAWQSRWNIWAPFPRHLRFMAIPASIGSHAGVLAATIARRAGRRRRDQAEPSDSARAAT